MEKVNSQVIIKGLTVENITNAVTTGWNQRTDKLIRETIKQVEFGVYVATWAEGYTITALINKMAGDYYMVTTFTTKVEG